MNTCPGACDTGPTVAEIPDQVEITVGIDGADIAAGILRRSPARGPSTVFNYHGEFLITRNSYDLDPALPRSMAPFRSRGESSLFSAFVDAGPDDWGKRLLMRLVRESAAAEGTAVPSLDPYDFFVLTNDLVRQGALRVKNPNTSLYLTTGDRVIPRVSELGALERGVDAVASGAPVDASVLELLATSSGMGGARPKIAVHDEQGSLWIAKFPWGSVDTSDVPRWEEVTARLARAAGIDMAVTRLVDVGDHSILLVRRFDRDGSRRIGYVSARTLVGSVGEDTSTALDVAEALSAYGASVASDLTEMYRRLVFSLLVSNYDNHLRNWGFLRSHGGWRLSPAFDINPDPTHPGQTTIPLAPGVVRPCLDDLLSAAGAFRLSKNDAAEIAVNIEAMTTPWREIAASLSITSTQCEAASPAFDTALREEITIFAGRSRSEPG